MERTKHDPTAALRQLTDADAGVRLAGAKWVHRHALAEMNRWSDVWLRHPDTVAALVPVLADPDPRVVEEAIGAVCGIVERYNRDARLLAPAAGLLSSDRAMTRLRAAGVVAQFGPDQAVELLLPLFGDPDKRVRAGVLRAVSQACPDWPEKLRQQARAAALECLRDRVAEVRCSAADLLRDVGEKDDLPALRACLAEVKGANYRQSIREAILSLQNRRTRYHA